MTALDTGGNGVIGPAVYASDLSLYGFYVYAGVGYIFKQAGPLSNVLASGAVTLTVNDVLRLEIAAGTLVAKKNGTAVLTAYEAIPLPVGSPGVQGVPAGTDTYRVHDWEGGNIASLPVVVKPVILVSWTYNSTGVGINVILSNLNTDPLAVQIDAWATNHP